ncbi:MAG: hypothetical protein J7L54_02825 [Elusimicrobia bacterium]|nr:hypothetical protein [Elusimicrobiota bacterium]
MKKLIAIIALMPAVVFADIDAGLKMRIRSYSVSNPDYSSETSDPRSYFAQRTRFYLSGILKKDIMANMTIQNKTIWGRSDEADFFLETGFISVGKIANLPVTIEIGRQNFRLNEGILIDDDNIGLDGIKISAELPLSINGQAAGFKLIESSTKNFTGNSDTDVYVLSIEREVLKGKLFLNYFCENDKSAGKRKNIMDFRYESSLIKDTKWMAEVAKIGGSKFDAMGYILRINAEGEISRLGKGGGFLLFASGSGDNPDTPTDENFKTATSHIKEYGGFGEYYIAHREDGRSNTLENLQITGFGFHSKPTRLPIKIFANYFTYTLPEAAGGADAIGKELDAGAKYDYTENIKFRLVFSNFSPDEATKENSSSASQILLEAKLAF